MSELNTINESISAAIDNEIALRAKYKPQIDKAADFKDALGVFFQKDIANWFSNQKVGLYNAEAILMKSFMIAGLSPDEATSAVESVYENGKIDAYSDMSWRDMFKQTVEYKGKKYPLAAGLKQELIDQEYINFNTEVGIFISTSSMKGLLKDKDVKDLLVDGSKVRLDDIKAIRERLTYLSGAIDLEGPADTSISQDLRKAIKSVNTLLGEKPPNYAFITAATTLLRTELPVDAIYDLRDKKYISDTLAGQLIRSIHYDMPTVSPNFLEVHGPAMKFERSKSKTEEQLLEPAPRDFKFYPGPEGPDPIIKASLKMKAGDVKLAATGDVEMPSGIASTRQGKGPEVA